MAMIFTHRFDVSKQTTVWLWHTWLQRIRDWTYRQTV